MWLNTRVWPRKDNKLMENLSYLGYIHLNTETTNYLYSYLSQHWAWGSHIVAEMERQVRYSWC